MVDYFSNENAPTEGNAPVNGAAPQANNGEDTGMAEISVSLSIARKVAPSTNILSVNVTLGIP